MNKYPINEFVAPPCPISTSAMFSLFLVGAIITLAGLIGAAKANTEHEKNIWAGVMILGSGISFYPIFWFAEMVVQVSLTERAGFDIKALPSILLITSGASLSVIWLKRKLSVKNA